MADDTEGPDSAKVIALDKVTATRASERKWGKRVMDLGFCIVPSLLLRAQRRLGLSPTQLAILMHLADRCGNQLKILFRRKVPLPTHLICKRDRCSGTLPPWKRPGSLSASLDT